MQQYTKAIIAAVMSVLLLLNQFVPLPAFLNEAWVTAVVTGATPLLVWWLPNTDSSGSG